jgi:hypothetical protein
MNTQTILANSSLTKTEKMRQLLALGLTRRQVADLTGGNYGFVQNVFARYWPEQVQTKGFRFIPFNRKFGIEIEAYGVSMDRVATALREAGIDCQNEGYNHTTRNHWKVISDASLNGTQAFELVSPILEGLAGLAQVETVSRVLTRLRVKINKTCGLHIHFDASGFGLEQMKNIVVNYANYEAIIDSFMPQSRRANNNTYCRSITRLAEQVDGANSINQMVDLQGTRYQKINLQAYNRHRSIEFRQHSGTIEFEKIKNWIVFLHNLVEYSKTKQVGATSLETLSKIQQPEVMTYLHNRINDLAA